jgi:hypothetical protein
MFNPLSLLSSWQSHALTAAATVLLVVPVTVWATSASYKIEIADMKTAYTKQQLLVSETNLAKYASNSKQVNITALALMQALPEYKNHFDKIAKGLKNESSKNPLPAACRPTADRLRILTAAVAAANATAFGQ